MPPQRSTVTLPEDLCFELLRALFNPTLLASNQHSIASTPPSIPLVPDGDSNLQYPEPALHTHTMPEGLVSEPGYITHEGSPIDSSSTSPTFTASPAFDTTPALHPSKPISSTLSNLDISELDKSYMNVPQSSTPAFHLCSAY